MKRFRFELQAVLDHRQTREDLLLAELAALHREEAEEVRRLVGLQQRMASACRELEDALTKSVGTGETARRDEYAKALRDDIKVQELTIEAVRDRVEAKRAEVVEAMKQRKVLEALRDRQRALYDLEAARAEQNTLDEMAAVRFARGM